MLSEIIESLCVSIEDPYELISSNDMLSRVEVFNDWVRSERIKRGENWDWREDFVLIGSNVKALFPSLSASKIIKIVRQQVEKSKLKWENLSDDWI